MMKYPLPTFLKSLVEPVIYQRWLQRKARSLSRKRYDFGGLSAPFARYMRQINETVKESDGKDYYTGERLDWTLIGKYESDKDIKSRSKRKNVVSKLPVVQENRKAKHKFVICSWLTNQKWLTLNEEGFKYYCEGGMEYPPYTISKPKPLLTIDEIKEKAVKETF